MRICQAKTRIPCPTLRDVATMSNLFRLPRRCRFTLEPGLIDSGARGGRVGAPDDPLARWRLEMICGSKE